MYNWLKTKFSKTQKRGIAGLESWATPLNLAGVEVSPDIALSLTPVFACVNVIASAIASMPFLVYERRPDGGRRPDPTHPIYDLIQVEPNQEVSANGFWTDIVGQAVLHGDGYAEIVRDDYSGTPIALYNLDSSRMAIKRTGDGVLYYEYNESDQDGRRKGMTRFLPENLLHIRSIGKLGTASFSPIVLARELIGTALAAQKTAASVFGQGSLPLGYFKAAPEMDEEARKTLREYWNRVHQGPYNAGKVAILEDGTEFVPLKVSLEELQYKEIQQQHGKQIAQLFGVPPHKIGILDDATYSNIEEQDLDFYKSTARIWCERVESESNRKLFTRQERKLWYAEHNMNAIVRGNLTSQTDHLVKAFGIGGYSVNNVLQELGQNPIGPDGDRRYLLNNFLEFGKEPNVNPVENPTLPQNTDEPAPEAAPEATTVPDEALEGVRAMIADTLGRCVKKEVSALRRAAKRPDLAEFARTFYDEHQTFVAEALAPGFRALGALSGRTLDKAITSEWASRSVEAITASDDIEALLSGWESDRVLQLMEEING